MPRDASYPRDFFGNPLGRYEKYNVERIDGRSAPGEKHHECSYFILDLTHDPHAFKAIAGYVDSCKETHPELADDLRRWLRENDPHIAQSDDDRPDDTPVCEGCDKPPNGKTDDHGIPLCDDCWDGLAEDAAKDAAQDEDRS